MNSRFAIVLLALAVAALLALSWKRAAPRNSATPAKGSTPSTTAATDENLSDPLLARKRIATPATASGSGGNSQTNLPPWKAFLAKLASDNAEELRLPREEVEDYVRRCQRDPLSLLAAHQASGDESYLTEALRSHPNDPRVLAMALGRRVEPEQRAQQIARLKESAPDNALGNYLAALDLFKAKQPAQALQELTAAAGKRTLDDYAMAPQQAGEEMQLLAGRSPIEARASSMFGLLLPLVSELSGLSKEMAALQKDYLARNDTASAESLAITAQQLARQISQGPSSGLLIEQLVASAVEKRLLENLNPTTANPALGQTPAERLAALKAQRDEIKTLTTTLDPLNENTTLTEPELLVYLERMKTQGELNALRWLNTQRTNVP